MADAGWYPDAADQNLLRYFDGQHWTEHRRPTSPLERPVEPRHDPAQAQTQNWALPTPSQDTPSRATPGPQQWGQPTEQQWAQPVQQQWGQPEPQPWQQTGRDYPWQPAQDNPWQVAATGRPPRRKKRTILFVAAAAVVLLAAGLVTWLVWPDSPAPKYTAAGKQITGMDDTLTKGEAAVNALVQKRHGAKNADTRCYFAQPKKPASGAKKSDIEHSLSCGPVLFVDGDAAQNYLSVPLTTASASGGKVKLVPQSTLSDTAAPAAVSQTLALSRPDKKEPPAGSAGLRVPAPPPAESGLLTVADLGPTSPPAAKTGAVMVGRDTKVTLLAAGLISRYGRGDDARSAPSGQKLMALRVLYGAGDVSGGGSTRAKLLISGAAARAVPQAGSGEWIIAAVPDSGAVLQFANGGVTQTLSLPNGTAGVNNIAVLTRKHRAALTVKNFNIPVHLAKGNKTGDLTFRARVSLSSLDYWIPGHDTLHASSPRNAILSMNLTYTHSDEPGKTFGFDPPLIRLKLPTGRLVAPRNVAASGHIDDVFEVPANFTRGTIVISGHEKVTGITVTIKKAASFPVIFAGG